MIVRKILNFWSIVSLLIIGCTLVSCSNDVLTEPATITFEVETTTGKAMDGKIIIDRLVLNFSKIDISGRRTGENDMYFTRNFNAETGNFILILSKPGSTTLQIPQGVYETLVFYTTLREEDYEFEYGSSGESDEAGDLGEYLTKAKPGLLLTGRYTNGAVNFPVVISLNDDIRRLAIDATQDGMPTVVLQKEIPALAKLTFDPAYLFVPISTTALENATAFPLGGEQAVMISEEYNENLYNQLAGRMQGAFRLTVENQ